MSGSSSSSVCGIATHCLAPKSATLNDGHRRCEFTRAMSIPSWGRMWRRMPPSHRSRTSRSVTAGFSHSGCSETDRRTVTARQRAAISAGVSPDCSMARVKMPPKCRRRARTRCAHRAPSPPRRSAKRREFPARQDEARLVIGDGALAPARRHLRRQRGGASARGWNWPAATPPATAVRAAAFWRIDHFSTVGESLPSANSRRNHREHADDPEQ